jgi:hypothetical protein
MQIKRSFVQMRWFVWAPLLVALLLSGILVPAARAGKFHFTGNSVTFFLGSLGMEGTLAGLGNEVAEVTLTGYGTVEAMCQNKGGQQAPGRNAIVVNTQQTEVFVTDQNGMALVQVIAPDPTAPGFEPSPTPKQAGCPNGNWEVDIVDGSTDWNAATIVVKDEFGQVQLDLSYTCTTFFENGVATDIECVES